MSLYNAGNYYSGARVLLTGATGFVGRWVARALSQQKAKLHVVVRDRSGALSLLQEYGVDAMVTQADLADVKQVRDVLTHIKPEITFNLAGYGVDPAECDEMTAYQINAQLGFTICQVLSSSSTSLGRGQSLVHVGSALEYGPTYQALREDLEAYPTTLYGKSKLLGTELITQCCKAYGVRGVVARLFTVYGPGEHAGRLLPTLLAARDLDAPIPLTSGEQARDFVYVEDVAAGLLKLGQVNSEYGEVVNLATGRLTTVREFVETAADVLGLAPERLEFGALPQRPQEMHHAVVSTERLERLTGWTPSTSIRDGIRRTADFLEPAYASG